MDPVKIRVALLAAYPPDNSKNTQAMLRDLLAKDFPSRVLDCL